MSRSICHLPLFLCGKFIPSLETIGRMEGSRSDREFESRARVGSSTIFFDRAILRETRTGIRGLFIPFGAVWLSQFALPVSRSPARSSRVSMPRVFFLFLFPLDSLSVPLPLPDFARVIRIAAAFQRSTLRRPEHELLASSFSNTWPLLSGFVGAQRRKTKSRPFRNSSLDDDKKRISRAEISSSIG